MSPSKATALDLCCELGHMCIRRHRVHVYLCTQTCLHDGLILKAHESLDPLGVVHRGRFHERCYLSPSAVGLQRGKDVGEPGKSSWPRGGRWRRAGPLWESLLPTGTSGWGQRHVAVTVGCFVGCTCSFSRAQLCKAVSLDSEATSPASLSETPHDT